MNIINNKKRYILFLLLITKVKIELLLLLIVSLYIIEIHNRNDFMRKLCIGYTKSDYKQLFIAKPSLFNITNNIEIKKFYKYIFLVPICSFSVYNRKVIRNTWGEIANKLNYKIIFYMGTSTLTIKTGEFNDVIQFSFYDSYFNLTISTLLIYNWTNSIKELFDCIIKVDSDVYPNIQLINLYYCLYTEKNNNIYGYYYPKMKTSRNQSNSNYIPKEIYPLLTLPEFVAGSFYIFPKLYNWSNLINSFNLSSKYLIYREDIQMGLYLKKQNITIKRINKYYKRKKKFHKCKDIDINFAVHGITFTQFFYIHSYCINI